MQQGFGSFWGLLSITHIGLALPMPCGVLMCRDFCGVAGVFLHGPGCFALFTSLFSFLAFILLVEGGGDSFRYQPWGYI